MPSPSAPTNSHPDTDMPSVGETEFTREVYGLMGVPIDVVDMEIALRKIASAVAGKSPFLISTVNLNFLVAAQADAEFRSSLILSDLCTADGMPIVWLARLLGIPIRGRLAGADIFEALKSKNNPVRRLKLFLFGCAEGVAAAACQRLNSELSGVTCVGSFYPGFTTTEEMSLDDIIDSVNSSDADFLAVALGAKKGQAWLLKNHNSIKIPVRAHLGATINFQAGIVRRAPLRTQKWGLEWLWRIKEEPSLWRRYFKDGAVFMELVLFRVVPLMLLTQVLRLRCGRKSQNLTIERTEDPKTVVLSINGVANAPNIAILVNSFHEAATAAKNIAINFRNTRLIDARFLGLLFVLDKQLRRRNLHLTITGVPRRIERIFRLSGFQFLLRY